MSISNDALPDQTTEATVLVATWSGERPQTLVSRKLVIDRLLDLRNIVSASVRADIDSILADLPGVTVVEGRWWDQQLATLETRLAEPERAPA